MTWRLPRRVSSPPISSCSPAAGATPRPCATHTRRHTIAPVFRSARTTVRSTLASSLLNQSPPLLPDRVPPRLRQSEVPTLAVGYCAPARRRAPLHHLGPLGLRLSAFPAPRFQSKSGTGDAPHRALTDRVRGQRLAGTPDSDLVGRRYTVELSIDPRFPEVPGAPGFPLHPCGVSAASEALVSGTRHTVAYVPRAGLDTRFRLTAGTHAISCVRPFPCRPIPWTSGLRGPPDWVEGGIAATSALRSRASPIRGTRLRRCIRGWRPRTRGDEHAWGGRPRTRRHRVCGVAAPLHGVEQAIRCALACPAGISVCLVAEGDRESARHRSKLGSCFFIRSPIAWAP